MSRFCKTAPKALIKEYENCLKLRSSAITYSAENPKHQETSLLDACSFLRFTAAVNFEPIVLSEYIDLLGRILTRTDMIEIWLWLEELEAKGIEKPLYRYTELSIRLWEAIGDSLRTFKILKLKASGRTPKTKQAALARIAKQARELSQAIQHEPETHDLDEIMIPSLIACGVATQLSENNDPYESQFWSDPPGEIRRLTWEASRNSAIKDSSIIYDRAPYWNELTITGKLEYGLSEAQEISITQILERIATFYEDAANKPPAIKQSASEDRSQRSYVTKYLWQRLREDFYQISYSHLAQIVTATLDLPDALGADDVRTYLKVPSTE